MGAKVGAADGAVGAAEGTDEKTTRTTLESVSARYSLLAVSRYNPKTLPMPVEEAAPSPLVLLTLLPMPTNVTALSVLRVTALTMPCV